MIIVEVEALDVDRHPSLILPDVLITGQHHRRQSIGKFSQLLGQLPQRLLGLFVEQADLTPDVRRFVEQVRQLCRSGRLLLGFGYVNRSEQDSSEVGVKPPILTFPLHETL